MIRFIRGKLVEKRPTGIIVETAGIGYDIAVSLATYEKVGLPEQDVCIFIYQYVREDQITLYGFSRENERELFCTLIGISGVGPKLALSILSHMAIEEFVRTIKSGKTENLTAIAGVGKKTAERLIFELKDKLRLDAGEDRSDVSLKAFAKVRIEDDVINALVTLGYSYQNAKSEFQKVIGTIGETHDVGELVRQILKK